MSTLQEQTAEPSECRREVARDREAAAKAREEDRQKLVDDGVLSEHGKAAAGSGADQRPVDVRRRAALAPTRLRRAHRPRTGRTGTGPIASYTFGRRRIQSDLCAWFYRLRFCLMTKRGRLTLRYS